MRLGGEQFGLALEGVREFCGVRNASPVPCCPPHIVGQMNLRGDILTLIDIRSLLGARSTPPGQGPGQPQDKVVVMESQGMLTGVLVDEVLDVLYLSPSAIDATPAAAPQMSGKYFSGGVRHGAQMLCLLDLPKMLREGGLEVDETV